MIEKNTKELNEILLLLRKYFVLPVNLLYRFMKPLSTQTVDHLIRQLIQNQYAFLNSSKTMIGIRRNFTVTSLMEKQHHALEIVVLFRKHLRYHAPMDFPSTIYFLLNEHECEVIVIAEGDEKIMNKLFSKQINSEVKRFIFIENEEQIPLIKIPNVVWFCRKNNNGMIEKYVQENLLIYITNEEKKLYQTLQKFKQDLDFWNHSTPLSDLQVIHGLEQAEKISLSFRKLCILRQINPLEISQKNLSITAEVKQEG